MSHELSVQQHLREISLNRCIPHNHVQYLWDLKKSGFEPKVIYDIGACVLHWYTEAKMVWPDAQVVVFDAMDNVEFLYNEKNIPHHMGVLSDEDGKEVKFYQNDTHPGGNSYYREIGCENGKYFPVEKYIVKTTHRLDTVVERMGLPLPDLIKIDVQGAEMDILRGAPNTLAHATELIVELQNTQYNEGALLAHESLPLIEAMGWKCVAPLFQNNGPDGDYGFSKRTSA